MEPELKELTPEAREVAERFARKHDKSLVEALSELVVLGAGFSNGEPSGDSNSDLLEEIRALRSEIGPVDFDVAEAIREIREDG